MSMGRGWPIKRLGDLCAVITKGTTPTSMGHAFVDEGINFIKVESISATGSFIPEKFAHISEECHKEFRRSQLVAGDILFSIAGALGRTALVSGDILPANTNQALAIVRLKKEESVSRKFLILALGTGILLEQIEKSKGGVAQQNLSLAQVGDFRVPIPTLPEQRRIVGILEEAFEGISTAKANAEKNLQNARALFDSHLQSIFTQRGKGWVEKRLGDLSRINYGYTESASVERVGPHFLRITDIQNNRVDWETVPYCPIDAGNLPKYKLADGDIVFARTGATTGKSYLVTNPPDAVFASYLIRVQLKEKELLPQFVNLFFQTHSYWDTIRAGVSGSAQGGFNATKLGELVIPFPQSLKEQKAIAERFDVFAEETQRLTTVYSRKLAALEVLNKSLLHQAFTGKL